MAEIDDPEMLAGLIGQLCDAAGDYSRARRKGREAAAQNWRQVFTQTLNSRVPPGRRPEVLALVRDASCAGADPEHVLELAPLPSMGPRLVADAYIPAGAIEALMGLRPAPGTAPSAQARPLEGALGYYVRTDPLAAAARPVRVPGRSIGSLLRLGLLYNLAVPSALADGPDSYRVAEGPWKGLGRAGAIRAFKADYERQARALAGSPRWPARRHELLSAWVQTVDSFMEASS